MSDKIHNKTVHVFICFRTLWQVQNEQVRKKVKDAIKWDMHKPQMLEGTALDGVQFDVVTASLCMCAASSTIEAYAEVIENIR